jgi:hypothetical protein
MKRIAAISDRERGVMLLSILIKENLPGKTKLGNFGLLAKETRITVSNASFAPQRTIPSFSSAETAWMPRLVYEWQIPISGLA